MHIIYVCECGLEQRIREVLTEKEFGARRNFAPNCHWYPVVVADRAAGRKWVTLRDEWLMRAWEPNQSPEDRVINQRRMEVLEKEMEKLSITSD